MKGEKNKSHLLSKRKENEKRIQRRQSLWGKKMENDKEVKVEGNPVHSCKI